MNANRISFTGIIRGARDTAGAMPSVLAFGMAFGSVALAANLSPVESTAMSALVDAGAAQFAALQLLHSPLPWGALIMTTLAINARHVALGITLGPWLSGISVGKRYAVVTLLSDANWAATTAAIARGERDVGHLLGGGLILWVSWILGTSIGALSGVQPMQIVQWGLDSAMPSFFVCALITEARSLNDVPSWLFATVTTLCASIVVPLYWAMLVGAAAGTVAGVLFDARR